MNQRTYLGARPTLLDVAKDAVEKFIKIRQRDSASRGDRYMLLTFEEPPGNIKAGWKESLATFMTELKNLQAVGMSTLGAALKSALDLLNINRMQTGIDTYGQGRCPFYLEPSIIILITDGGRLTTTLGVQDELNLPMHSSVPGSELTKEPFRWDQRLFSLVLRLTGIPPADREPSTVVPSDHSPVDVMCEVTGDLNPCDFSLWGHMKDLVYKKKPIDLISLKMSITDSFASIKRKTLVTDNFATRYSKTMAPSCKTSFKQEWLEITEHASWLRECQSNKYSAMCLLCNSAFSLSNMGKQVLTSHQKSKKHEKAIAASKGSRDLRDEYAKKGSSSKDVSSSQNVPPKQDANLLTYPRPETVSEAEILGCLYSVMEHSSFRSAGQAVDLTLSLRHPPQPACVKNTQEEKTLHLAFTAYFGTIYVPKLDSGNDSSVINDKAEIDTETEEDADDIDQSHQSIAIEEDGKGADKDRKISWTTAIDNSKIEVNSPNFCSGLVHNLPTGSDPSEYFKLFFMNSMCETVRVNTNKYAEYIQEKKNITHSKWKPVEFVEEIWNFLSVMLIMSIARLSKMSDYWASNPMLGNDMIKRTMTRDRFMEILRYFHLSNREEEKNAQDEGYNIMQKLDPFMKDLKLNFLKHFSPYRELSINEALIKYKGRLGIV
ncbi:Integrator complex subunit 6-A [Araneus ventricosus]|uniref:Integrator complex subunit 6-A n=1 Tax=Araneus ventricosus TaxID=182803 RepID=A0A4Y2K838_ARAVE|nr:Integrator complex subunit 6-A [Araneus ventricosus]